MWTNPGGTDLVVTSTTDAMGTYLFDFLPDGDHTITVDTATLPLGVDPIVDPDGGADNTAAVVLDDDALTVANEGVDLDQDFAYVGTASLGDLVWDDLDGDGVVDVDESGIAGVDVAIVWTDPVTGATFSTVVTTAADGSYGLGNLPGGDYTISIDPVTLPEGMVPTFDLDGGRDRTATVDLGAGEDRTDVDFGERREADLAITKSSDGEFAVGAEETWTVTVTNNGPAIADGITTVTDTVPVGVTPVRVDSTDFSCTISGQEVACTLLAASLAVDATAALDIVVLVEPQAAPGITNIATVGIAGGPADPDPANDTATDAPVAPLALLGLTKTLLTELVSGEEAAWQITVTNFGPSITNDTVRVVDTLPPQLTFVRVETDDFTCSATGPLVDCTTPAGMAVGESRSLVIVTLVDAPAGTIVVNEAEVTGGVSVDGGPLDETVIDEVLDELDDGLDDDLGITTPDGGITPVDDDEGPVLAFTGADIIGLVIVATVLVLLGLALVAVARRRPAVTPPG